MASEPANLRKFFLAADVQINTMAEGMLLTFPIREGIAIRILVSEPIRQTLLAQLTGPVPTSSPPSTPSSSPIAGNTSS